MKALNLIIVTCFLLLSTQLIHAQNGYSEKITDKWPYLYQEFQEGLLYFDGSKISKGSFNIDIVNQELVFFESDNIVKSVDKTVTVDSLILNRSKFLKSDAFYEVIAQKGVYILLKKVRIDLNAAGETGGGYGTGSSTDATTKLTSVDVANYTGIAYDVMKLEIGKGKVFETIISFYLASGADQPYERASKKSFDEAFPTMNVKELVKTEKTKFNKQEDLLRLFNKCVQ